MWCMELTDVKGLTREDVILYGKTGQLINVGAGVENHICSFAWQKGLEKCLRNTKGIRYSYIGMVWISAMITELAKRAVRRCIITKNPIQTGWEH